MSKEEDWEKKIEELLEKKLKPIIDRLSSEKNEPEVHHVFDPNCPTCKPKIDAYVNPLLEKAKEDIKKIFKERSDPEKYPYRCVGDGCGVSKEEEKDANFKCPTCGETRQRRR
jgi:DNA-directed RNA polymerase subunit RPC12/RpoP